ncbi:MAG: hypothetical protein GXP63_00025 [DPANN group archaeon]|nr:hypothetical protein [DPANN group archaeon]
MRIFDYRWYLVLGAAILLMIVGLFLGKGEGAIRYIPSVSMITLLMLSPLMIGISVLYLIREKEGKSLFAAGLLLGILGLLFPLGVLASYSAAIP